MPVGDRYNAHLPTLLDIDMNDEINYANSPLHGLSLKTLLTEIVDHYGFEILFAYLNINCFKTNPSIASSIKFLKKTTWACEKVEAFYLYEFKNLPKVSSEQYSLPPRDRIIPDDQTPGEPAELSLEDAEQVRDKRTAKASAYNQNTRNHSNSGKGYGAKRGSYSDTWDNDHYKKDRYESQDTDDSPSEAAEEDPWAKWR